jgi:signal transduction histidine kinase
MQPQASSSAGTRRQAPDEFQRLDQAGYPSYRDARILLIDDHPPMVMLLKKLLEQDGYRSIRTADSAEAALQLLGEYPADMLLVDVNMPGMNGFALVQALREQGRTISVIFATGSDDDKTKAEAFRVGAADFLVKPINPYEFLMRVRNQAERRMFEKALQEKNDELHQHLAARRKRLDAAISVLRQAEAHIAADHGDGEPVEARPNLDFIAHVSHELRTPLNVVSGFTQMIRAELMGPLGNAAYREYIEHIDAACAHMTRIVSDLQDLVKAEKGSIRLDVRPVEMAPMIHEAAELLRPQAKAAGVSLVLAIDPDLGCLRTDQGRVRQIVFNLVNNAIKFTPQGGRVTVKASRDSESGVMILVISDTGIGIPPEDLPLVMKPFRQGRDPDIRGAGGIGLGLALCEKLAKALGGSIELKSKPGVGTSVTVRLPDLAAQGANGS